jgi:hypothetical protein
MPGLSWCIALVTLHPPEADPSVVKAVAGDPNFIWYVLIPIVLVAYLFAALSWMRRTNPPGAVVIQYSPPLNLSPAAMRYVVTGEFDEREVAASIVHLSARVLIRFQGLDQYYSVSRTSANVPSDLPPEELAIYRVMFNLDSGGTDPFPGRLRTYEELPHQAYLLPPAEDQKFQVLADAVKKALKAFTEQKYFTPNFRYIALRRSSPSFCCLFACSIRLWRFLAPQALRLRLSTLTREALPGRKTRPASPGWQEFGSSF